MPISYEQLFRERLGRATRLENTDQHGIAELRHVVNLPANRPAIGVHLAAGKAVDHERRIHRSVNPLHVMPVRRLEAVETRIADFDS